MALILTAAMAVTTLTAFVLAGRWRHLTCTGSIPVSFFTFVAILFTSGLDVGLIMFPLVDFQLYASEPEYAFANPLAIEFGFWGFLIWAFYFLTTFYFCIVEPKLKLFEIPLIKMINNMIGTVTISAPNADRSQVNTTVVGNVKLGIPLEFQSSGHHYEGVFTYRQPRFGPDFVGFEVKQMAPEECLQSESVATS